VKDLRIETHDNLVKIAGSLDLQHFAEAREALQQRGGKREIDLSGLTHLDTAGAWLLLQAAGHAKLEHLRPEYQTLLELVKKAAPKKQPLPHPLPDWMQTIIRLGKNTLQLWPAAYEFIAFMGHAIVALGNIIRRPSRLRLNSITHHMEAIGINAVFIVSLVAMVISIVIAYQGQVQLKAVGAEQYTVNLIAVSVLREMGVLLTAIMIAGRSGSAFTAEIGTMRVRQEVDALQTMGFEPFELLVVPRLIALLLVLPLLTVLADIVGLFAGSFIMHSLTGMSIPEYFQRVRDSASWKDFTVGMIKAPVFAFVIALVGCMHGLKVSGSAESVGKETTASVVKAIFLVLMLDGFFSIYFQQVGL